MLGRSERGGVGGSWVTIPEPKRRPGLSKCLKSDMVQRSKRSDGFAFNNSFQRCCCLGERVMAALLWFFIIPYH